MYKILDAVLMQLTQDCIEHWSDDYPDIHETEELDLCSSDAETYWVDLAVSSDTEELLNIIAAVDHDTITIQLQDQTTKVLKQFKCSINDIKIEVSGPLTVGAPTYKE